MLTYNRAHLIGDAINSILQQTVGEYEILILDDGSTDDTKQVLESFQDSRISYHSLAHCGNLSILRNYGMAHSKGEFIAFLDSDDVWENNKLDIQLQIMDKNPSLGFVFCNVKEWNGGVILIQDVYPHFQTSTTKCFFDELISGNIFIYPSALLFRRSCLLKTGTFFNELRSGDSEFIYRLAFEFEATLIKDNLVHIRKQSDSFSRINGEEDCRQIIFSMQKFYSEAKIKKELYRKVSAKTWCELALIWENKGKFPASIKANANSILLQPFALRVYFRIFRSFLKRLRT
jgi:glycosyltransferase involved in cell wall biosynthesis